MTEIRLVTSEKTLTSIKTAAANDEQYELLKQQILVGWPANSTEIHPMLKEFVPFADELLVCNDLIFKGQRLLVPVDIRQQIGLLEKIHSAHIGINGCIRRARDKQNKYIT